MLPYLSLPYPTLPCCCCKGALERAAGFRPLRVRRRHACDHDAARAAAQRVRQDLREDVIAVRDVPRPRRQVHDHLWWSGLSDPCPPPPHKAETQAHALLLEWVGVAQGLVSLHTANHQNGEAQLAEALV